MIWSLMRKRCIIRVTEADITAAEAGHGALAHTAITEMVMIEMGDGLGRVMTDPESGIRTEEIEAEIVCMTGSVTGPEERTGAEIKIDGTADMTAIDRGNVRGWGMRLR